MTMTLFLFEIMVREIRYINNGDYPGLNPVLVWIITSNYPSLWLIEAMSNEEAEGL